MNSFCYQSFPLEEPESRTEGKASLSSVYTQQGLPLLISELLDASTAEAQL